MKQRQREEISRMAECSSGDVLFALEVSICTAIEKRIISSIIVS